MSTKNTAAHPATIWQKDARHLQANFSVGLRLAAMAGHMHTDKIAARRAALIDLLADGRPHPREAIFSAVEDQLGTGCWGKRPQEALARDLAVLRRGGIIIGYSRQTNLIGYYLQYPPLSSQAGRQFDNIDWTLVNEIGQLPVPEKNRRAFAAADFALTQKRLILATEHSSWSEEQIDRKARRLVYGVAEETVL